MDDVHLNEDIKPNIMQNRALKEIQKNRDLGLKKALVIAATGSGKTYLAAFDVRSIKPKRILLDYLKMPEYINKLTGMSVPIGKFVWFNDKSEAGENGIKSFPDMQIKKDWA
jgi:hypothetical protein